MDIKLKNKFNIKYLIIAGSIFLCAVIMVGLYPFFEKKAEQFSHQYYLEEDEHIIQVLVESCYVLYRNAQNQVTSTPSSPVEVFLPGLRSNTFTITTDEIGTEEEFTADILYTDYEGEELENHFLELYQIWETNWHVQKKSMDYQVSDLEQKQILIGNRQEDMDEKDYTVFIRISYDDNGNATISNAKGVGNNQQLQSLLQDSLDRNPLSDFYNSKTRYDSRYQFVKPVNLVVTFGMDSQQLTSFTSTESFDSYWDEYPYHQSGSVVTMTFCLSLFLLVLAFFIPVADTTITGNEWYSKGFLEPAVIGGFCAILNPFNVTIVSDINRGLWEADLLEAGFLPFAANILITAGSIFWWLAMFFIVFGASSSLLSIRNLKPSAYFKERCLTYHTLSFTANCFKRVTRYIYNLIVYADKNDESRKSVFRVVLINFLILAAICSAWFFGLTLLVIYSIILYIILLKYFRDRKNQYKILLKATNAIAEGNLDVEIQEDLGMFEPYKTEIQKIQQGFKKAVDEEVKSQRMKTDLISNVSHDLKTPLTAIITYVNLLKDESITPEQRQSYIDVLDRKSMRLKSLIEDIFEISKATSQNVTLNLMDIDIVNLLKQVRLELEDKIEESNLDFRWKLPDTKIILALDSQKTFRIFENLLLNILKYALPGTRVYIDMSIQDEEVYISMKNVSTAELTWNPNDMTERFARGDQARNTEGSGLGLAIVKSFVELQKGKLVLEADGDLFKATIRWKLNR